MLWKQQQRIRENRFGRKFGETDSMRSPLSNSGLTSVDELNDSENRSETAIQKLSSNLESLLLSSTSENSRLSDVVICAQNVPVYLHKCILSARCPFFQELFMEDVTELQSLAPDGDAHQQAWLTLDLMKLLNRTGKNVRKVGHEAFIALIGFLYSAKLKVPIVTCMDDQCMHEACRPVIDFAIEMLCLSCIFHIPEMIALWVHRLLGMSEKKAQVDDVIPILLTSEVHGVIPLQTVCTQVVAMSNLDKNDLEKRLPREMAHEILTLRVKLGLVHPETSNPVHEKQCNRIYKALDSDDVELVQMLLKEGRISLDACHALHYIAAYCDPHTLQEILGLGLANPNLRDKRGFTVLHVGAMRRDPTVLVNLLIKGVFPLDLTLDGRTALQISRRLTRSIDYRCNSDLGEELQRDKICIEILEQAGKKNPFADTIPPLFPAVEGKELFMRLLYLENRVAFARLLFPQEAKIIMGIVHLDSTSEFTGLESVQLAARARKEAGVDLNLTPTSAPRMDENAHKRLLGLQKTVELGKRFFPRCSLVLNTFMDDDLTELTCLEKGSLEEQRAKRQRYMELKNVVADAYQKDVAAMDRPKTSELDIHLSCSSSSSSSGNSKRARTD